MDGLSMGGTHEKDSLHLSRDFLSHSTLTNRGGTSLAGLIYKEALGLKKALLDIRIIDTKTISAMM